MSDKSPDKPGNSGADDPNDKPLNVIVERPLECSECRKKIAIKYTEIVGGNYSHTSMCDTCPEKEKRLKGGSSLLIGIGLSESRLACGHCGTTLDAVRMGHPLGCSLCYEVFADTIFLELVAAKKLPARITHLKKRTPLHVGRAPGEANEVSLITKLLSLNEALTDTLKAENYEQAAFLRDQIRALTESHPELSEKSPEEGKK